MRVIKILLCLCAASQLCACSSVPLVKQPPEWGYEKDAIQLHLKSDPRLNLFQKQPHSLVVCLYHLRDPNGFNQLVDERDGLPRLLDCSRFDPSVTYARRVVVQPDQELVELSDRTEGARFVGVVAGYYTLRKESSVRAYPIPVQEIKKDKLLWQRPARLNIDLYLAPDGIGQPAGRQKSTTTVKGGTSI